MVEDFVNACLDGEFKEFKDDLYNYVEIPTNIGYCICEYGIHHYIKKNIDSLYELGKTLYENKYMLMTFVYINVDTNELVLAFGIERYSIILPKEVITEIVKRRFI